MADSTMDAQVTEKSDVGGVEGPEAMYVKLIASDGHEFIMKRDHALTSGTIKNMLSGPGKSLLVSKFRGLYVPVLYDEWRYVCFYIKRTSICGLTWVGFLQRYTVKVL